jgi:hypothetical protein
MTTTTTMGDTIEASQETETTTGHGMKTPFGGAFQPKSSLFPDRCEQSQTTLPVDAPSTTCTQTSAVGRVDSDEERSENHRPSVRGDGHSGSKVFGGSDDGREEVPIECGQVLLLPSSTPNEEVDEVRQPPPDGNDEREEGLDDSSFNDGLRKEQSSVPPDALVREVAQLAWGPPIGDGSPALGALDRLYMRLLTTEDDHLEQQFVAENNIVDVLLDVLQRHMRDGCCVEKVLKILRQCIYYGDDVRTEQQVPTEMAVKVFQRRGIDMLVQALGVHQNEYSPHCACIFKTIWSILMDVVHDAVVARTLKSSATAQQRGLLLYAAQLCLDRAAGDATAGSSTMRQISMTLTLLLQSDDTPDSPTRLNLARTHAILKYLDLILTNESFRRDEPLWEDTLTLCVACISSCPQDTLSKSLIGGRKQSFAPLVTKATQTFPRNGAIQGTACLLVQQERKYRSQPSLLEDGEDAFSTMVSFFMMMGQMMMMLDRATLEHTNNE